jgi:hypothetical protein
MIVITIEIFETFDYYYIFDTLTRVAFVNEADFVCFWARFDLGTKLIDAKFFFITTAANIRVRLFAWSIIINKCPALIQFIFRALGSKALVINETILVIRRR